MARKHHLTRLQGLNSAAVQGLAPALVLDVRRQDGWGSEAIGLWLLQHSQVSNR